MSHDPTRKQFFAKLLGLTAAFGVLSKLGTWISPTAPAVATAPVVVRPETRAVARDVNAA